LKVDYVFGVNYFKKRTFHAMANATSDKEKVQEIFECLKIDGHLIKSIHRIGKKTEVNNNEDAQDPPNENEDDERNKPRNRYRPIRVVLETEEAKWKLVKSAPNIKKVKDTVHFQPYEVFITPDYTILQREREADARRALKKKRDEDPNGGWKLGRNFKLVKKTLSQENESFPE